MWHEPDPDRESEPVDPAVVARVWALCLAWVIAALAVIALDP